MPTSLVDHLEKLNIFTAVARARSLSRAAKEMRLAQPSLSHAVKVLEACLGTELFVRTSRGMELTAAGRRLQVFSERLLSEATELESQLRFVDESLDGRIEIGTKEPYAVHLWPRYLESLYQAYPRLEVHLHVERSNSALLSLLVSRKLDLCLIPEPEPQAEVRAYEVFRDRYAFFLSPRVSGEGILPVDGRRVRVASASGLPLILFRKAMSGGHQSLEQRLLRRKLSFHRLQEVSSFEAARAMALQGLGMVVLPRSIGDRDVKEGSLLDVTLSSAPADLFCEMKVCLCLHAENAKSRKLRALLRHLRKIS